GLFQHVEAGNPDDRIDVAADDDLQDDGRPFRDEYLVTQLLGLDLEVGDGAGAALLAVQAELIVVGGTALGILEAVRQQQQAPGEWDGLHLLAPELVADRHHGEAEVLLAQPESREQLAGHRPQALTRKRDSSIKALPQVEAAARTRSRSSRVSG